MWSQCKVVINGADPLPQLQQHKNRFQPDLTILYVRDPWVNWGRLSRKSYGGECGETSFSHLLGPAGST